MRRDNRGNSRGDRRSGGRNFNNRGFGGKKDFGSREKFEAVCDGCGETCMVPFKPTSGKPVYCDDCFSKNKSRDGGRNDRRSSGDNGQLKEQLNQINAKLDKVLSILQPAIEAELDEIDEFDLDEVEELKPVVKKEKKATKKETKKAEKKTVKKVAKK